jgi:hypothetical protein
MGSPPLPPELADVLQDVPAACLLQASDQGTVAVIKLPGAEIARVRGTLPIAVAHALHDHPAAPVLRTTFTLYDDPTDPLVLEAFTNIADPQQRAEFAALAQQASVRLLFYDETLTHRLTKLVTYSQSPTLPLLLEQAAQLRARIPPAQFDFDAAKRDVLEGTPP